MPVVAEARRTGCEAGPESGRTARRRLINRPPPGCAAPPASAMWRPHRRRRRRRRPNFKIAVCAGVASSWRPARTARREPAAPSPPPRARRPDPAHEQKVATMLAGDQLDQAPSSIVGRRVEVVWEAAADESNSGEWPIRPTCHALFASSSSARALA